VATSEIVIAPMPGIILSILVDEGQIVSAGDPLLVLEAMKMENEIHAPRSGMVKKILVRQGSDVRQGTPLIELA
jgi:biotin carboxyl carrier protein